MGRTKSPAVQRTASEISFESNGDIRHRSTNGRTIPAILDNTIATNGGLKQELHRKSSEPGVLSLLFSVGGIYASFLTWAVLQERITTTSYGPASASEKWTFSIVLNTVQSFLAALSGFAYLCATTSHPHKPGRPAPIFPSSAIVKQLLLVAITTSLASPFGYASLKHVDYITFILAKSSKLLPVMALHITLYGKRYPVYKYLVVVLVTIGVGFFTVFSPGAAAKAAKHSAKNAQNANRYYGLGLLGVNLLLDGLTNTVQEDIFKRFKPYSGPQMMCALNIMSTILTSAYLLLTPYLSPTRLGRYLQLGTSSELSQALSFASRHPTVFYDVLGFSLCGALGQIFIYHTLSHFGSLLLVTVTVTRKMLTMVLSVVWFGHRISPMQWAGVALVFGGVGGEALMSRREKLERDRIAKARTLSEAGKDRAALKTE